MPVSLSVNVTDGGKPCCKGRLVKVDDDSTLASILQLVCPDLELQDGMQDGVSVKSASSADGKQEDGQLDDCAGIHVEFGRRHLFFVVQNSPPAEVPQSAPRRSIDDALMAAAAQRRLPSAPKSGPNGTATALDTLVGEVIEVLRSRYLGFPADLCDSEGLYVVRSIARALWTIDGHHSTLTHFVQHNGDVPAMPPAWAQFAGKVFNDYQAKKKKRPQMSAKSLHDHAGILFGMLDKPVLRTSAWKELSQDIDALATIMEKYSITLDRAAAQAEERRSFDHVVRPLSQFSDIEIRSATNEVRVLTVQEQRLLDAVSAAGEWEPVELSSAGILGEDFTAMQKLWFLQSFKLNASVAVYRYAVGGAVGTIVFFWLLPHECSPSDIATKSNMVVEKLRPSIPQYHTRQMRQNFTEMCSNITTISPIVRRYLYTCLSGDASTPETAVERDTEERMRLVVLGELPELAADLRHLSSGRPGGYDVFLAAAQDIIRDCTAEDKRRHGVAHMSHFLSQRDLHKQASDKCPEGTPIPSVAWLALQFHPKSSQASSALKYTGKLNVRYCIQSRQLRAAHEDDHYCLSLFKLQRAMAVELAEFSHFVCLDDKAKIPIGEPDAPMSTGVRNRHGIAAGGATLAALDHDQASKGSLTPSVVLLSDIPTSPCGSFYQGTLHVLLKDTVYQPSTPARHAH
eukprot:scpid23387/ scgid35748/ 